MQQPWETEPDELDFESHDLPCRLRRGPLGAWCGYVGIPPDHPLHGVEYSDHAPCLDKYWQERKERPLGNCGIIPAITADLESPSVDIVIEVHGSITWSNNAHAFGRPDGLWWFGFDCSHVGDFAPEGEFYSPEDIYRTMPYARGECEALAGQLAATAEAT